MWYIVRRLSLGISLILLISAVLLILDRNQRKPKNSGNPPTNSKQDVSGKLTKKWKIGLIEYNNVLDVEESEKGVMAGLREAGLAEGADYVIKVQNAQGDMPTVNGMVDAAVSEGADLLITLSTPTLQAALQRARSIPIVFTYIANAVVAGAGKSNEDHMPNVTGVYMEGAYDEMMSIIREYFPFVRVVGTLFTPSEVNTVLHKGKITDAARKAGIGVVAVAANSSAEVSDAALALCNRKIDAVCQIPGNLTASSFPGIAQAARKAMLPIFAFQSTQAQAGAAVVLARDYYDGGKEAGLIAARVMRGENPANIPFQPFTKTKLIINLEAARAYGLKIPPSLLEKAQEVIGR
ncbi:MAG TPA: ABC transporter substrate-binding protein [Candidatus Wunengus sp. YC60]|uniref:ABC transporter substrate-binding protein n=1 Tax=Candidatus Wunengus sp. YC60 TaxID=3367697 RepID=UPI0040282D21